jgi:hypothetical protein
MGLVWANVAQKKWEICRLWKHFQFDVNFRACVGRHRLFQMTAHLQPACRNAPRSKSPGVFDREFAPDVHPEPRTRQWKWSHVSA